MSIRDFEIIKELGKGAFGSVHLGRRKADGNIYAVKRVKISQLNPKEQENALNEVRILASITHPNIIGYKEAFFEEETKTLNIVMEYADDGDLENKIQRHIKNKTNFSENEIWSYLIQMIQGLKALHDNRIMHRDLKSANVFLLKNGTLKLGDLNVSKVVKLGLVYTQTGTPYYASPEVWADKPYDYKSDIWSCGCVIYELCTLKPPFKGNNLEQLYKNVSKGIYDPIPSIYKEDLRKVVSLLLQTNPLNRPNCDMLLNNSLIVKRMDFDKNIILGAQAQLLGTIRVPRNMNDIKEKLPKTKKYVESSGLTMKMKEETMKRDDVKERVRASSAKIENRIKPPSNAIKTNQINNPPVNIYNQNNYNIYNQNNYNIYNQNNYNIYNKNPQQNYNINDNIYKVRPNNIKNEVVPINIIKPVRASSSRPTVIKDVIPIKKYDNSNKPENIKRTIETRDKSPIPKQDYRSTPIKSRPTSTRIEKTPVIKKKENIDHRILVNPIKLIEHKKPINTNLIIKGGRPGSEHGVIKVISNNEQKYHNIYRK